MPKGETSNRKDTDPSFEAPRHRPQWLGALLSFVLGVLFIVALFDFEPAQSAWHQSSAATTVVNGAIQTVPTKGNVAPNAVGVIGAEVSWWSHHLIGASTLFLPVFLLFMSYVYLRSGRRLAGLRITAMLLSVVSACGLLAMQDWFFLDRHVFTEGPGGLGGKFLYETVLRDSIGPFGSAFLLGMVYLASLLFIFTRDIGAEFERLIFNFQEWRKKRAALKAALAEERRKRHEEAARQKAAAAAVTKAVTTAIGAPSAAPGTSKKIVVPQGDDPLAGPLKAAAATAPSPKPAEPAPAKPVTAKGAIDSKPLAGAAGKIELNIVKPEETKKAKAPVPQSDDKTYEFPPIKLLAERAKGGATNNVDEHRQNAENLLRILSEFGVEVTLGEIHVGPVITRYEVVPAAGVRVEKISGLDKNIALGMRAQSVRILAPIPGKAAVGVEVPNQNATPVGMRDILESEDWAHALAKAEIPVALGKDVSGKPIVSDLTKMPHLLIAGATGSGKSVCINSIIASVLYSKSPKNLRLLMVDPKIVELKIFNTLPHMLIPVVTEPKKVPAALKWLLKEMEQRYQIFAKCGVRNITGFNNRKKQPPAETPLPEQQAELAGVADEEIVIPDRLPYIVAIIDELADLMMVAPADIETNIARLAQLARAAGIHLIIATQRPSVNVITGVIKANLPSRIAFQVASQVDSRTILDTKGADTLIGRGDMLFSPPGTSRLVRAQGAFVSDEEVSSIVEFLKRNGPPIYAKEVQEQIDRDPDAEAEDGEGGDDGDLGDDEDLYQQALDVLKSTRRASTSMIQRRLRIGYNRAARIMDLMEQKGVVGPENGSSPREILVDLDSL
jgi:S-DNA-T family DNA segregation ATPase FtsK/SpoIIIE